MKDEEDKSDVGTGPEALSKAEDTIDAMLAVSGAPQSEARSVSEVLKVAFEVCCLFGIHLSSSLKTFMS